jgi:hypothetical protein
MVRHEAAEALGSIASDDILPALKEFAAKGPRVVRESCEVALDMYEVSITAIIRNLKWVWLMGDALEKVRELWSAPIRRDYQRTKRTRIRNTHRSFCLVSVPF